MTVKLGIKNYFSKMIIAHIGNDQKRQKIRICQENMDYFNANKPNSERQFVQVMTLHFTITSVSPINTYKDEDLMVF